MSAEPADVPPVPPAEPLTGYTSPAHSPPFCRSGGHASGIAVTLSPRAFSAASIPGFSAAFT